MELKDPRRAWGLLERSFANITEPFKASLSQPQPTLASHLGPWLAGVGAQLGGSQQGLAIPT